MASMKKDRPRKNHLTDITDNNMFLYGASGHGKVIKDIAESQGKIVDGFIDDNPEINSLSGLPVKHSASVDDEVMISIGVNKTRKKIAEKVPCTIAGTMVHTSAVVSPSARIAAGSVVMAGAIVNADAKIGKHCIINTGASVDHECVLGDYVHIAPHATLCGQVEVGEGTLIGVGASVIPCVKIGKWCTIGAGAAVTKDVPDGVTVVGVPGRIIKR